MSFRGMVFWGIALAVLSIVAVEALFDIAIDAIVHHQERADIRVLEEALDQAEMVTASQARVAGGSWEARLAGGREAMIELRPAMAIMPSVTARLAESNDRWMIAERSRPDGSILKVAVARTLREQWQGNKLLLDLLDLPLFVVIAFVAAAFLTRGITRPVRQLTTATEDLAQQRFPSSVATVTGNDELARLARSFNRMSVAVQRYLERERTFTRYASHELRTPLAALKVQVERAQHGSASTVDILPALERNVRRMEEVIEALHSIARAGERDTQLTSLPTLIQDVLAGLPLAARARIAVDTAPPEVLVTDASLVRQGLHNLLDNALRHGSGPVALSVLAQHPALTLQIRDMGPGVDPEALDRLTEPFYRSNGSRQGLGLGLALVDMIAHALEGELDLRNTGKGFEATLRLPIVSEVSGE